MIIPFLLTLISALLYVFSFPPFSLSLLAWVALVPLFLVCSMVQPRSAAVYGLLWGVVMTCGFGWYFAEMVANYFRVSLAVGWMALFAVSILLFGLYFGVFALWLSWMVRRQAASPLLVAAGWGLCEFARANFLIGNPLALAGYSQVEYSRLMQIADATGPYGVGMLIAAVNASLAGLFSLRLLGYHPLLSLAGVLVALGVTLGYGEWRRSQTFATGEPVEVAVVQGAIERQLRWKPEHRQANLHHYLALTKDTVPARPSIIFWPEYAVNFYLQENVPEREAVFKIARDLGADVLLGGLHYRYGVSDLYYHNSVFLIRRGKLAGRYDKIRLLPFAEDSLFTGHRASGQLPYEPGRHPHLLRAAGVQIGAFLCFEAMYPDLVRSFTQQGAEILANPANDDWFGHSAPARHLLDIARVRAIENRRYLVRPTTTGFSAIIDPQGRAVALSGFGTPEILTASVRPSRAETPYQHWRDTVSWVALVFVTIVSLYHRDWHKRK